MLHQDEAHAVALHLAKLGRDHGLDVASVAEPAHEIVGGSEPLAVELQDVAAGVPVDEVGCGRGIVELMDGGDRQAQGGQHVLGVAAIVFQPVAIAAASDDVEAVAPQSILQGAALVGDVLEQHDAVLSGLAQPVEFLLPAVGPLDDAGQGAVAERFGDRDLDLVTILDQAHVERIEVAGVADAQKPHVLAPDSVPGLGRPASASDHVDPHG